MALGELRFAAGRIAVRFDRTYDASVATVWASITDPAALRGWLGDASGAPTVRGALLRIEPHGRRGVDCVVRYVDPERMLEVDDGVDAAPDAAPDTPSALDPAWRVVLEVVELTPSRTLLVIEVRGLAEDAAAACAAWWHGRLDELGTVVRKMLDAGVQETHGPSPKGGPAFTEEYAAAVALLVSPD